MRFNSILILSPFFFFSLESSLAIHNHGKIETFLSRLLQRDKFEFCKIMFLGHENHEESFKIFTYVTKSTNLSGYNMVFPSQSVNKSILHPPVKFLPSIWNHYKRSGQCFVVIIMVEDPQPQFMTQVFNMITPIYIPKTRKDEDYFVFVTKDEDSKAVLMLNQLPARTKFKIAISLKENGELVIRSVCFFCNAGSPAFVEFPDFGDVEYFPDFVTNLNGRTLRVSVPSYTSRMEVDPNNHGKNNAKRGLWKNLFDEFLGVKFNFTYRVFWSMGNPAKKIPRGGTGLQSSDGSWTGIVGDLYYGNADLGILGAATPKRIHYMENSDTFFDLTYLTFVTSTGTRIYSPLAMLWPFNELMWLLIGLSTVLSFVIFKLLLRAIDLLGLSIEEAISLTKTGAIKKNSWGLGRQIELVIATFLEQDCVMPTQGPLRSYIALWLFFTLIITSVYKSKMVSLMAFPITESIPKTFQELAYSEFSTGFMKHGDSAYNTWAASDDPVYIKLVAEMEVITGVGLECLEKVVKSKYACIAYQFALKHLQAQNLSILDTRRLAFSPDSTYNVWLGLNYEGRSIFKQNFDKWLRLTRPMHFADIWERDDYENNVRRAKMHWWQETNQWEKTKRVENTDDNNLTLVQIVGVFYLLGIGILFSSLSFAIEVYKVNIKFWPRIKLSGDNFISDYK